MSTVKIGAVQSVNTLQKFIIDQINQLADGSQRKFADLMGVRDTTIGRALHPTEPTEPTVDFLVKLAKATNTDIRDIIVMVSPDDVIHGSSGSAAALLARLDKLSNDDRELIDKYIAGALARFAKGNQEV